MKVPNSDSENAPVNGAHKLAGINADPWVSLRKFTNARIALGRTGGSQLTQNVLEFRLAHARAKDAVLSAFDVKKTAAELEKLGIKSLALESAAGDKSNYLMNPDSGRILSEHSRLALKEYAPKLGKRDVAIIISDGLSATAAAINAVPAAKALIARLDAAQWSVYPVIIASFGRVKLQDEIGEILGARHTVMLVGERPGLGAPDSLSCYFTYAPKTSCTEADRNCISNIRPAGLPPQLAAKKIFLMLKESVRLGLSGVGLKDNISEDTLLGAD